MYICLPKLTLMIINIMSKGTKVIKIRLEEGIGIHGYWHQIHQKTDDRSIEQWLYSRIRIKHHFLFINLFGFMFFCSSETKMGKRCALLPWGQGSSRPRSRTWQWIIHKERRSGIVKLLVRSKRRSYSLISWSRSTTKDMPVKRAKKDYNMSEPAGVWR